MQFTSEQIKESIREGNVQRAFPWSGQTNDEAAEKLKSGSLTAPLIGEILAEADRYRSAPIQGLTYSLFRLYETTGDREQYQQVYFGRRGRLSALAIAALLSEERRYLEALQDTIWEICNEYTWCLPAHLPPDSPLPQSQIVDLFAAETAHALAEILCLLEGRLAPEISARVRVEIEQRVFTPIYERPGGFFWETATHNWASVCAGAAGMAALLLVRDKARLAGMMERTIRTMDCFLAGYGSDGGCAEGVGYWEYGFGYFVYFAEMLSAYTAGALDLMEQEKVKAIIAFPETVHLSGGVFANYSDSQERFRLHPGLLSRLAERAGCESAFPCEMPGFCGDPCFRWAHLARNLMWTEPGLFQERPETGFRLLGDLSWAVDRRAFGDGMAAFSAKGGHNDEPHNHNDLGHFILHACGVNLLNDLGHGLYTKDYFGARRYDILNNSSAGHSVPVVNGYHQAAGEQYEAKVLHAAETDKGCRFQLDVTEAYPVQADASQFIRTFEWESSASAANVCLLTVRDHFIFRSNTGIIEERFVSGICPDLTAGVIVWASGRTQLTLRYDAGRFEADIESIPHVGHSGEPVAVYIAKLKSKDAHVEIDASFQFELLMMES